MGDGWDGGSAGWQDGSAAPLAVRLDDAVTLTADAEDLCVMLDSDTERTRLYVRWICDGVAADDGRVFREVGRAAAEFHGGRLALLLEAEPLQLPMLCARLACAATTFFAAQQRTTPGGVLPLILRGAVFPALELRRVGRSAMSDEVLDITDELLQLSAHSLTHFEQHRTSGGASPRGDGAINAVTEQLLDLLDDGREETPPLAVHMFVIAYALSAQPAQLLRSAAEHRLADAFGSTFVSLFNRGAFRATAGATGGMVGLRFALDLLDLMKEAAEADRACAVLYPSDCAVLAEVLVRELNDDPGDAAREALLRRALAVAASGGVLPQDRVAEFAAYAAA